MVQTTFHNTVAFLPSEVELMPLSRWTEAVFRYFFCRFLATDYPEVEQFVECGKIDLVLRRSPMVAFIEFKFYRHPRRFDPYDGRSDGFKGGPGRKNLHEFQSCIDKLHERPSMPDLSKYVVLVYVDPTDGSRPNLRFSHQYNEYLHPSDSVALRLLESSRPVETTDGIVQAQLYELG